MNEPPPLCRLCNANVTNAVHASPGDRPRESLTIQLNHCSSLWWRCPAVFGEGNSVAGPMSILRSCAAQIVHQYLWVSASLQPCKSNMHTCHPQNAMQEFKGLFQNCIFILIVQRCSELFPSRNSHNFTVILPGRILLHWWLRSMWIYQVLLHWRLCGMWFYRTCCIGDFVGFQNAILFQTRTNRLIRTL